MTEPTNSQKSSGDSPPGGTNGYKQPLVLQELYLDEKQSAAQIAELYDVSRSTIYYWLKRHDIERRGPESRSVPYMRTEVNNYGHVVWRQTTRNRENVSFPVHRLIAVSEYGADEVAGSIVHHQNGIPWDNRPENLELMERGDHTHHHNEPRVSDEELLADLRAGYRALGGVAPTSADVEEYGQYGVSTYLKRFGTFVDALRAAGIEPRTSQTLATPEPNSSEDEDSQ